MNPKKVKRQLTVEVVTHTSSYISPAAVGTATSTQMVWVASAYVCGAMVAKVYAYERIPTENEAVALLYERLDAKAG